MPWQTWTFFLFLRTNLFCYKYFWLQFLFVMQWHTVKVQMKIHFNGTKMNRSWNLTKVVLMNASTNSGHFVVMIKVRRNFHFVLASPLTSNWCGLMIWGVFDYPFAVKPSLSCSSLDFHIVLSVFVAQKPIRMIDRFPVNVCQFHINLSIFDEHGTNHTPKILGSMSSSKQFECKSVWEKFISKNVRRWFVYNVKATHYFMDSITVYQKWDQHGKTPEKKWILKPLVAAINICESSEISTVR